MQPSRTSKAPSFKEREKQRREQEILCAAGQLIAEHGYAALTMDDLAEAVGISKPTLYQHFKSKDDLLKRVVVQTLERLEEYLGLPRSGTPLERLQAVMSFLLEHQYEPGSVLASLGPELIVTTLKSSAELAERKAHIWQLLCGLIDDGKAQGQIDPATPTPVIVRAMFCLLGVLSHPVEGDPSETINHVIHLFLSGITSR